MRRRKPGAETQTGGAFVSGGSSGIGLAIARRLAQVGIAVAIAARGKERLDEARSAILAAVPQARVTTLPLDVADMAATQDAVDAAAAAFGGLSWAVASAGIARPGLFLDQPLADHVEQMDVNYFGSLHLARAAVPHLGQRPGGHLVFIASGAALYGVHGYTAYGPSKFAVRGLAESLRVELEAAGVAVTLAYPPDTDTPQLAEENRTKPAATRRITETSGIWDADEVARRILVAARAGRFAASPGFGILAVEKLHSLIGPLLRARQIRIVRAITSDGRKD